MKTHKFFIPILCLLCCSTTLASSSSDSERTLSNPGSPVRHSSPRTSPTIAISAPSLTHFVRFDDIVQRPGQSTRPTRPTPTAHLVKKTREPNPNSLSAQLERSRAYFRKEREEKSSAARWTPLHKEAQRSQAVNVYVNNKPARAKPTGAGVPAGGSASPVRPLTLYFPVTSQGDPLLAGHPISEEHPIFGPQSYKFKKRRKTQIKGSGAGRGGDSDGDWTPASDRALAKQKAEAKQKAKEKAMAKATTAYKDKGKGKAVAELEPRPKMRKLIDLG
ncbi:hypothetical protein BCV69DRAFT_306841 [Microstroma glucosiphilum]|uniref:Uncharacterized protein n=1 Tax=Pseudomicrostroma glucosiphilum TaxID=1684307 RepID=A0A316UA60_9BASI|nr:hypothetical protein BCV69DRAFT_306841 [Pseudomicrostroma glucosiphilum]PWN21728.1 hypothetical protein BCV69DRAFT_306841 [Pseudomicrostroma glucosiphilum]